MPQATGRSIGAGTELANPFRVLGEFWPLILGKDDPMKAAENYRRIIDGTLVGDEK